MALFVNNKRQEPYPPWEDLPSDVLMVLFENMPASSLAICMFVNQNWRYHVIRVLSITNRWEEIFNVSEFKIKCNASLDQRQMYYNYILWHNFAKGTLSLHKAQKIDGVKKINVYRDHLIVVSTEHVQYYDAVTLRLVSTVNWSPLRKNIPGEDFLVNDLMVVEVFKPNAARYLQLKLFIRSDSSAINATQSDVITVDNIICYKIHNNKCYVLDYRNGLSLYTIVDGKWQEKFVARDYGNPDNSCAINLFENRVYLMQRGGYIVWMDENSDSFKKFTPITAWNERNLSRITEDSEIIHRKMFMWSCMHDIREKYLVRTTPVDGWSRDERDTLTFLLCTRPGLNGKKNMSCERSYPGGTPLKGTVVLQYKIRNVSCMLMHGDVLFLGHLDGTVELLTSGHLSKTRPESQILQRFNVRNFVSDIAETAVISLDVYEEEDVQHLFVATKSHLLHFHVTHTNCEDYMWGEDAYWNAVFLLYR